MMKSNNNIQEQEDQEVIHIISRAKLVHHLSNDFIKSKDMIKVIRALLKCSDSEAQHCYIQIIKLMNKDSNDCIHLNALAKETQIRINKGGVNNDPLYQFFTLFYVSLLSKSEGIVFRLKLLSKCPWVTKQNGFPLAIEYILRTIAEGDLYDLDLSEVSKHVFSRESSKMEFGSLVQYSQIESSNQREKDFTVIRSTSKKYTNPLNYSSVNSNNSINNKKRRSSNLLTIVSPSIIARLYTQICKIGQVDFNIFDLDDIVGKKATVYVANEILSKFDLVENEMIPSEILSNFINEIVDHYDRTNAVYHNDLHAGDVMQTVFTIVIKGNLQEVSIK